MKNLISLILILSLAYASCRKKAGEGGTSRIKGKVHVEDWNAAFTVKNGEYEGADEDVYIIYGDDVSYGERVRASYNGEFEFRYLRKGKYKVYVYSKDKTLKSQSGDTAFVMNVDVSKNKQTITLTTFTIYK